MILRCGLRGSRPLPLSAQAAAASGVRRLARRETTEDPSARPQALLSACQPAGLACLMLKYVFQDQRAHSVRSAVRFA